MVTRSSKTIVSTHGMLSRKKGRRYGEGYQKALQISVRMLPLVGIRRREGATVLPGFRVKRNAWCLFMNAFAALWLGERSFPTRRRCRKAYNGLSSHETAEISFLTLLLRWRLCRWRSLGGLYIAQCSVDIHALHIVS